MDKPPTHYVFVYSDPIIQFGMITLFASTITLGPLFSFVNNAIQIQKQLNKMSTYARRPIAKGATGAGFWVWVMEVFAIICVPINIAIMYFAGEITKTKDHAGTVLFNNRNSFSEYLGLNNREYWTPVAVVLLCVFIEHGLLALKVIIATIIPDVPGPVIEAEGKRQAIIEYARQDLLEFKVKNKMKSYNEILRETENTAAADNKDHFKAVQEAKDRGFDLLS